MKKVRSEENPLGNENYSINEYKYFPAEKYYSAEVAKSPLETISPSESFQDTPIKEEKDTTEKDTLNQEDLKNSQKYTEHNETATAHANTTSHAVTESVSAATGTVASIVSTAAVAVVGVSAIGAIFISPVKHINYEVGQDYVKFVIDSNELLTKEQQKEGLGDDYFVINIPTIDKVINIQDGYHTYYVHDLQPNSYYQYSIELIKTQKDSKQSYYSNSFYTKKYKGPTGYIDEENSYQTFNPDTDKFDYNYAIYCSDPNEVVTDLTAMFYVGHNISSLMGDPLASSTTLNDDGAVVGTVTGLDAGPFTLQLYGTVDNTPTLLYEYELEITYPESVTEGYGDLKLGDYLSNSQSTAGQVVISGDAVRYNPNTNRQHKVDVYELTNAKENEVSPNEAITVDTIKQEGTLITTTMDVDPTSNMYEIKAPALYDLGAYYFVVSEIDPVTNNVLIVYESDVLRHTVDNTQFNAEFDTVTIENADASYTKNGEQITVTINTLFNSLNEVDEAYSLKVSALNNDGVVLDTVETRQPIVTLTFDDIESAYLEYEQVGTFYDGKHIYGSISSGTAAVTAPAVNLGELSFANGGFSVDYVINTSYDLSGAELTLHIEELNSGKTYDVLDTQLYTDGQINISGQTGSANPDVGKVKITPELSFVRNQTQQTPTVVTYDAYEYDLSYHTEITNVYADISKTSQNNGYYVVAEYTCFMSDEYTLEISDNLGNSQTMDKSSKASAFNMLSTTEDHVVISIDLYAANHVLYQALGTYDFYPTQAMNAKVDYTWNNPNPGDALVTKVDKNHMSVYRNINWSCDNPDQYYDAMLTTDSPTVGENRDYMAYLGIHNKSTDKISKIENVPCRSFYGLAYISGITYKGMDYILSSVNPSGGIEINDNNAFSIEASYSLNANNNYELSIAVTTAGALANEFMIDGVKYTFDQYDPFNMTYVKEFTDETLIKDKNITIYYNVYWGSNDSELNNINTVGERWYSASFPIYSI